MALTRKFLKALGIEEDKIEEIVTAHGETVAGLKDEIEKAKQGAESLAAVAEERDKLKQRVEALEKASGDAAKVQADFDAYKKQIETDKANAGKKALVKKALEALPEVEQAEVSHQAGTAVVTLRENVADEVLKQAVEAEDYTVISIG